MSAFVKSPRSPKRKRSDSISKKLQFKKQLTLNNKDSISFNSVKSNKPTTVTTKIKFVKDSYCTLQEKEEDINVSKIKFGSFDDVKKIEKIEIAQSNIKNENDNDDDEIIKINKREILYKKNNIEINKIKEWFNIDINKILFITGPMCSGKSKLTAELIENLSCKNNILFLKPDIYKKYNNDSRPNSRCGSANMIFEKIIKNKHKFISINDINIINTILTKTLHKEKVLIIEESQFFEENVQETLYNNILNFLLNSKIKIIIVYLDLDFKKQKFGFMEDLYDKLKEKLNLIKNIEIRKIKLTAECNNYLSGNTKCNNIAFYTYKNKNKNDLSQKSYFPVCENCYNKLNN